MWALVILVLYSHGPAIDNLLFESESLCNQAKVQLEKDLKHFWTNKPVLSCVRVAYD